MTLSGRLPACGRLSIGLLFISSSVFAQSAYDFNDSHFHLTNYIQEGTDIRDFLKISSSGRTDRMEPMGRRITLVRTRRFITIRLLTRGSRWHTARSLSPSAHASIP